MSVTEKNVLPTGETDSLLQHQVNRGELGENNAVPLKMEVHLGVLLVRQT